MITKLTETLKHLTEAVRKSKIVKIGLAFVMSFTITVSAAACAPKTPNPSKNPPDQTITDPSDQDPTDDPYANYSGLLKSVLNDNYYNGLIAQVEQDHSVFNTPLFDPHPYTFLQEQGHDVAKIKSGALKCTTETYIKNQEPNNLYMITYVENQGSFPYYTEYLLKASLTDAEMADYKMLNEKDYIQSLFINDQIAKSKNLQIVSECNMSVEAHTGLQGNLTVNTNILNALSIDKYNVDFILQGFSEKTQTFDILLFENTTTEKSKIGNLKLSRGTQKLKIENNIFKAPYTFGNYTVFSDELTTFTDNTERTSIYNLHNRAYAYMKDLQQ